MEAEEDHVKFLEFFLDIVSSSRYNETLHPPHRARDDVFNNVTMKYCNLISHYLKTHYIFFTLPEADADAREYPHTHEVGGRDNEFSGSP